MSDAYEMRTIEGSVREEARHDLERALHRVFSPVLRELRQSRDRSFADESVAQVVAMQQRLIDEMAPKFEQIAIDDFVRKVMSMKEGA